MRLLPAALAAMTPWRPGLAPDGPGTPVLQNPGDPEQGTQRPGAAPHPHLN